MAYDYVQIPAGATVKIGDDVGSLADIGVLKGDAAVTITGDRVTIKGSKAEEVQAKFKNMSATMSGEMYQLNHDVIDKMNDGIFTRTAVDATPVAGAVDTIVSGNWAYNTFVPLINQDSGDLLAPAVGATLTINSVTGGTDLALTINEDFIIHKVGGLWGITIIDSVGVTTLAQNIVINYGYTPAAGIKYTVGAASTAVTGKVVELSYTNPASSKLIRIRMWNAKQSNDITLNFLDQASDELNTYAFELMGDLDVSRTSGDQLLEIYTEDLY
jgi:hypothetical protein